MYQNRMRYRMRMYKRFNPTEDGKLLFDRISKSPSQRRYNILLDIEVLINHLGLAYALIALYRQQVNSGFVLADPLQDEKIEKKIHDVNTGITFRLQWNPYRELRKNHNLLIERGVIVNNIQKNLLINIDKNGRPCYLCKTNIDIQNPAEVLLEINLAGEKYYAGANFAYITNNHFTLMNAVHKPQKYRKKILEALNDFVDKTDGYFRAIFNGLAGASIEEHEHLQATTEKFPIEDINIENEDIIYDSDDLLVSQPKYYIYTWILQGTNKTKIINIADIIIRSWHDLDVKYHTENIICTKTGSIYRTFIITRDKRKLIGKGKKVEMATFDASGNIVLSYESAINGEINERETFNDSNFEIVRNMLKDISPTKRLKETSLLEIIKYE